MSTQPIKEEEIDLGNFFNQIVKLFKHLFAFIGKIFKGIYHLLILVLIFIKNYFMALSLALILGLIVGFIINNIIPKTYYYKMVVKPNYQSIYHIKDRVAYYNQLITNKDTTELTRLFDINNEDACSLKEFIVEGEDDDKTIINNYNEFIETQDSIILTEINFNEFKNKEFYKYYSINLLLRERFLSRNIQRDLLKDFNNNAFLLEEQKQEIERLKIKENYYKKTLSDIDSLRAKNKEIALIAAKNDNSKSIIDLNKDNRKNDSDVELLNFYRETTQYLDSVIVEKKNIKDIYNVITPFEAMGNYKVKSYKNPILIIPILFLLATILFLLRKPFFSYLDNYKKA